MSSESAHFLVGAALSLAAIRSRELTTVLPVWIIPVSCGLLATVPDLDLVWSHVFGPVHSNVLRHRGLFHSPFFLILAAGGLAGIVMRNQSKRAFAWLWLLWAVCMLTHPLLDALTTGGRGVMLLAPFTTARFHFPWQPLQMASEGEDLLHRAWLLRWSEVPFCAAAAAIGAAGLFARRPGLNTGQMLD